MVTIIWGKAIKISSFDEDDNLIFERDPPLIKNQMIQQKASAMTMQLYLYLRVLKEYSVEVGASLLKH